MTMNSGLTLRMLYMRTRLTKNITLPHETKTQIFHEKLLSLSVRDTCTTRDEPWLVNIFVFPDIRYIVIDWH
jgi:hypothetical protein